MFYILLDIFVCRLRRLRYCLFSPRLKGEVYYRREKGQDFVSDDRNRWRVK
jgi:hypothetical protein